MGGSTTQTSKNETDPQIKKLILDNYARAQGVANAPFNPYTGVRVAGFTDDQKSAQKMISDMVANNTGGASLAQAGDIFRNVAGYKAPVINSPGSLTAQTVDTPTVKAGLLKDVDLAGYMNPFQKDVIDTSLADLQRQRDIQRVTDNQSATAAKAFGGSRQGVADSLTNEAALRAAAATSANLRSQGYSNAQAAAAGDLNRQYGADTFNAGNQFTANQFNANANNAANQFNLMNLLDVARTNASNDLASAGLRLNAGGALSDLSSTELNQALQRAGALAASGDVQQQNQQANLDALYDEFMRAQNHPIMMQQLLNGTVTTLPMDGTTTQRSSQSLGLGSILGGIGAIGSAFSDRRMKTDIKRVGALPSGLPLYSFRFKQGDGTTLLGVMADEAEKLFPEAVTAGADGYSRVDYSKIR